MADCVQPEGGVIAASRQPARQIIGLDTLATTSTRGAVGENIVFVMPIAPGLFVLEPLGLLKARS